VAIKGPQTMKSPWGPIYKETYDNLTTVLRQIVSYEHLTTCLTIYLRYNKL